MVLELRIAGPGLDVSRLIQPGEAELVLGRDADCGVCLPDPQRNVSRRHLAVWNEEGVLHFRVLSVVNGVEMPFGEAPPGARGVLPEGQQLRLAEYSLTVGPRQDVPVQATEEADPWAVFDTTPRPPAYPPGTDTMPATMLTGGFTVTKPEDDPFGDWGFETTFGPGSTGGEALDASKLGPAPDLTSFFRGLGLDPTQLGPLSQGELEAVGRLARAAVLGLLELHADAERIQQAGQTGDGTVLAERAPNPLKKADWTPERKLQYVFGGRAATAGLLGPERALHNLLAELQAHSRAVDTATRETVESTLREFSPEALKSRLLTGGARLFEGARAWDAYNRYYADRGQALPAWVQDLMGKYFTEAYQREALRIKRETPPGRQ